MLFWVQNEDQASPALDPNPQRGFTGAAAPLQDTSGGLHPVFVGDGWGAGCVGRYHETCWAILELASLELGMLELAVKGTTWLRHIHPGGLHRDYLFLNFFFDRLRLKMSFWSILVMYRDNG